MFMRVPNVLVHYLKPHGIYLKSCLSLLTKGRGLLGHPSEQLNQHKIDQGKKYGGKQIGHLYFDYVKHIEAHGHDEQAAYSGHLRYYLTGQERLHERRTHGDASLVEKHRRCGKEDPDAQRCGEDDGSQSIQHRLGEQGIVVTGQTAFQ